MRLPAAGILISLVLVLPPWAGTAGEERLDVPLLRQQKNGCGAASVAMIVRYWASQQPRLQIQAVEPEEVHRQLFSQERGGVPLAALKGYLQQKGFHAFTLQASWNDLEDHLSKRRPLIACLKKGPRSAMHYAVVVGIEGKRVWVNDPSRRSARAMKRSKFEKRWSSADRWLLLAVPDGR